MQGRIYFDEGTDQWRILVNTVRKFGFRKKQGISWLAKWLLLSLVTRRSLCHGVGYLIQTYHFLSCGNNKISKTNSPAWHMYLVACMLHTCVVWSVIMCSNVHAQILLLLNKVSIFVFMCSTVLPLSHEYLITSCNKNSFSLHCKVPLSKNLSSFIFPHKFSRRLKFQKWLPSECLQSGG